MPGTEANAAHFLLFHVPSVSVRNSLFWNAVTSVVVVRRHLDLVMAGIAMKPVTGTETMSFKEASDI